MRAFAHGRFRRRPKLWNVRALIGAVAVAAEKPSFAEQSAVETKSGAPHGEFPRKLCCIKANGGGMLAGAIPQGPDENRKIVRAQNRLDGEGAKAAVLASLAANSGAATPGQTIRNGAREARGVAQRCSTQTQNQTQRGSRAPLLSEHFANPHRRRCRARKEKAAGVSPRLEVIREETPDRARAGSRNPATSPS
jgi:hypothetical protein